MGARRHAEIAGAGFAGLTAAAALCKAGWTVRVHEASPQLRAFGAGIFLFKNGLEVLRDIGAYDDVVNGAYEPPFHQTRDDKGNLLSQRSFTEAVGTSMLTMTRQHLYVAVLGAALSAGAEVRTNSRVVGARAEGILRLENGEELPADLVIGADGVHSKVRQSLDLTAEQERFGYGITRLLVDRTAEEANDPFWANAMNFWSATRRVLHAPCNASKLYLALGARIDDKEAITIPVKKEVWIESFPIARRYIERIADHQGRFDEYETIKAKSWSHGKVAIVGDAAHGMPPTIGQGAGSAMMNALSLARFASSEADLSVALAAWEAKERPGTEEAQDISSDYARTRAGADGREIFTPDVLRAATRMTAKPMEERAEQARR